MSKCPKYKNVLIQKLSKNVGIIFDPRYSFCRFSYFKYLHIMWIFFAEHQIVMHISDSLPFNGKYHGNGALEPIKIKIYVVVI